MLRDSLPPNRGWQPPLSAALTISGDQLSVVRELAQMDCAGLFAAERRFIADVAVLAELPDISEIGIPATDLGKADHLMGENHQRLLVLLGDPALQQSGINADMSAADPRVAQYLQRNYAKGLRQTPHWETESPCRFDGFGELVAFSSVSILTD